MIIIKFARRGAQGGSRRFLLPQNPLPADSRWQPNGEAEAKVREARPGPVVRRREEPLPGGRGLGPAAGGWRQGRPRGPRGQRLDHDYAGGQWTILAQTLLAQKRLDFRLSGLSKTKQSSLFESVLSEPVCPLSLCAINDYACRLCVSSASSRCVFCRASSCLYRYSAVAALQSELHDKGHMTAGHRLFCKDFLCFNTALSPCALTCAPLTQAAGPGGAAAAASANARSCSWWRRSRPSPTRCPGRSPRAPKCASAAA